MKLFILLMLYAIPVSADYWYLRAGIGKNAMLFTDSDTWEDQGSLGCSLGAGHRHHLAGNFYGDLSFTHNSQCFVGRPFNDYEVETESDHLVYFVEYRWH